jgi:hypothetical protein
MFVYRPCSTERRRWLSQTVVNDPDYVCVAGQLCRSVGDHTSLRSPCINCNQLAHHFCAEYWYEQNPVEPHLVITIKDLSKGGKLRLKNTPSAQKCNVRREEAGIEEGAM